MKYFIKRKILFIVFIVIPLSGCAETIIGTAVGTGVYTYLKGEVKRSYFLEFDKCLRAANEVLSELNVTVTERSEDTAESILKAKRTNGSIITISLIKLKPALTQISIRSGAIGMWDKRLSELIHESIVEKLQ